MKFVQFLSILTAAVLTIATPFTNEDSVIANVDTPARSDVLARGENNTNCRMVDECSRFMHRCSKFPSILPLRCLLSRSMASARFLSSMCQLKTLAHELQTQNPLFDSHLYGPLCEDGAHYNIFATVSAFQITDPRFLLVTMYCPYRLLANSTRIARLQTPSRIRMRKRVP